MSWGALGWAVVDLGSVDEGVGAQGRSVEWTTRSDERVCACSRGSVCWAVDRLCVLFTAQVMVSEASVAVWVLTMAQVVVPGVVVAAFVTVVACDVAVAVVGSGCVERGWEVCWGTMGRPGSEYRHS